MSFFWTLKKIFCRIGNQTDVGPSDFHSMEENVIKVDGDQKLFGYPYSSK